MVREPAPPAAVLQSSNNLGWTFTSWDPSGKSSDVAVPPLDAIKIDISAFKLGSGGGSCAVAADTATKLAGRDVTFGVSKPAPGDSSSIDTAYAFKLRTSAADYCISAITTRSSGAPAVDPARTLSQVLNSVRFAD